MMKDIEDLKFENTKLKNIIRNSKDVEYLNALINNLNSKYEELKQLKETIDYAISFCRQCLILNLESFDTKKLLEKLLEILLYKKNYN